MFQDTIKEKETKTNDYKLVQVEEKKKEAAPEVVEATNEELEAATKGEASEEPEDAEIKGKERAEGEIKAIKVIKAVKAIKTPIKSSLKPSIRAVKSSPKMSTSTKLIKYMLKGQKLKDKEDKI